MDENKQIEETTEPSISVYKEYRLRWVVIGIISFILALFNSYNFAKLLGIFVGFFLFPFLIAKFFHLIAYLFGSSLSRSTEVIIFTVFWALFAISQLAIILDWIPH